MEFGLFNQMYHPIHRRAERSEHDCLMEELAIIEIADRVGFKYSWSAEHHFLDEYSHLSASETFMAYALAAHRATSTSARPSSTSRRPSRRRHASPSGWRCSITSARAASSSAPVAARRRRRSTASASSRWSAPASSTTRRCRRSCACGPRTSTAFEGDVLLDAAPAACCPSRTPTRIRRSGSPPAHRARSRRRPASASACCASRSARPTRWRR